MRILEDIIARITEKDARHGKKLAANFAAMPPDLRQHAQDFLLRYTTYLERTERDLSYSIDSYLWMINMMMYEQIQFVRTGEYSCTSFAEAEKNVYNNTELMEQYMHGLLLSQFLWRHHFLVFDFFTRTLDHHFSSDTPRRYLEIGGGHGLYLGEAIKRNAAHHTYHCVDISQASIDMARTFLNSNQVTYFHRDIYDFQTDPYDFITMGEVLEHVEDPVALLKQVGTLLKPDGRLFITTPTNAATVDHIYLFRNRDEIADVTAKAGFNLIDEFTIYSEEISEERAAKMKVPMMFAGVLQRC